MQIENYSESKRLKNALYEIGLYLDFFNKRIRVDDYRGNIKLIIQEVTSLTTKHKFEKMIIKCRFEHLSTFLQNGFMLEGIIEGYFLGNDAYLVTKYFTNARRNSDSWIKEETILTEVYQLKSSQDTTDSVFKFRQAEPSDAVELSSFYNQIFKIYPTPLNQPNYIQQVMKEGTVFYLVEDNGTIISAASAEINDQYKNAEITDCATLPSYRKQGLMKILIEVLEKELIFRGIYCSYSIARSLSFGMNACLFQLGYTYTGRLVNNCYIYDKLEDMNIWVKDLSK